MDINKKIKYYMELKKVSYSELSKLTGISKSSLQRYVTGTTSKIPYDAVNKIEQALSLEKASVIGGEKLQVGEYIKKLRIEKGLSQEELGKIIGVQRAAVQKWESGKTQNLKITTIQKLSELFSVSFDMLLGFDNRQIISLSDKEEKLIIKYREQPQMQEAVNKILGIEE